MLCIGSNAKHYHARVYILKFHVYIRLNLNFAVFNAHHVCIVYICVCGRGKEGGWVIETFSPCILVDILLNTLHIN